MIVYTAIAGTYPIKRDDIACFHAEGIFERPVMEAKRYKILPHLFFPEQNVTIWIDGNIWLKVPPETVVDELLQDADMAAFAHPFRANVWQEFGALGEQKRFQIPWLQAQLRAQEAAYRDAGLSDDAPLLECSVLIRRNSEAVGRLMNAWWAQICRWQWRDQVSLPYVLWKQRGVKLAVHPINVRDHPFFRHESQHG